MVSMGGGAIMAYNNSRHCGLHAAAVQAECGGLPDKADL